MATKAFTLTILLLSLFMIAALPVHAAFDVSYEIQDDAIYPDEIAEFTVTLFNNEDVTDSYTIFSIDPSWTLQTDPVLIRALPGEATSFVLTVAPNKGLVTGPHLLPLRFKSVETTKNEELSLFIYLKSYTQADVEYRPSVALGVGVDDSVDPRDPMSVDVVLRNRNALDIQSLDVKVTSELFSKTYTTTLGPLEEKTNEILFDIDSLIIPGTYEMQVEIVRGNQSLSAVTKNFKVIDYSKIVEESYTVNELFKSTEHITVTNEGNERKQGTVQRQKGFIARWFTSTEPNVELQTIEGRKVYQWDVSLNAQGSNEILVIENYRFLASIIVVIILIIVGYFLFRSPLITVKRAKFFGSKEEGMSFVKIKVFMKNRTKKPVYNIKVIDKVPRMAKVVEDHDVLGSLKPSKIIRHERAGTIVRWDIEKLDSYEERIITYKIRSHLKIVGSIHLDAVKLKFDTGLGKERATYSNSVNIDAESANRRVEHTEDARKFQKKRRH